MFKFVRHHSTQVRERFCAPDAVISVSSKSVFSGSKAGLLNTRAYIDPKL